MFKNYAIYWHLEEDDAPVCVARTRNKNFANHLATQRSKECGHAVVVTGSLFGLPKMIIFDNGKRRQL